ASSVHFHIQNMFAIAAAIAIRAANENIAEKLHFNFFKPGAAAAFALALAGVEAKRARVQAAAFGCLGLGEDFANIIERADVNGGIGSRCFAKDGLVHKNNP